MESEVRKGLVYYRDALAGELTKAAEGYSFRYDDAYFSNSSMPDISATLPKTKVEYKSKVLFPFFFGLLAEGVQKERQCRELRIDERDHFTRLLETGDHGAIGAIRVVEGSVNA